MASLRPPDFFSIGAQKCATTWLYHCLGEHPQLFLGRKNQIKFFENPYYQARDWSWYLRQFAGAAEQSVIGDARVEYVFNPETPGLIAGHLPRTQFILILRDPVERAVSAYNWNVRQATLPDLGLEEGISLTFFGTHDAFGAKERECFRRIIEMGFYDQQIRRYLRYFDPGQFLILLHDDVRRDPEACIRSAYRFLGVDPTFVPAGLTRQPLRSAGIPLLTKLERKSRFIYGTGKLWEFVNQTARRAGLRGRHSELSREQRQRIEAFYRPHNKRLVTTLLRYHEAVRDRGFTFGLEQARWLNEAAAP